MSEVDGIRIDEESTVNSVWTSRHTSEIRALRYYALERAFSAACVFGAAASWMPLASARGPLYWVHDIMGKSKNNGVLSWFTIARVSDCTIEMMSRIRREAGGACRFGEVK